MFTKVTLDYNKNLFNDLLQMTEFEDITKGRKGAILVDISNNLIPLVRTTTRYVKPSQTFKPLHHDIIKKIRNITNIEEIKFNNALIEVYDNQYCTMGFHSDQALDLAEESYIAIYSCYEIPQNNPRKLIIQNKLTNKQTEIIMEHNSVVLFNLPTNKRHLHKMILDNPKEDNRWLGITFRESKTFIHFVNKIPFLGDNILTLANDHEIKNFYQLRGKENKSIEYKYPEINYTISPSDILPVK